jgi:glycerol-3-phosphate acyltransferase PlsX
MRIAVDAMGGDLGPAPIVEGAIKAASEKIEVILVGKKKVISPILSKYNIKNLPIFLQNAEEVVAMDESPSSVVRNKKDSSMAKGINLVKEDKAKAFITPGNTGAVLAYGIMILKRVQNIQRPAIAVILPTKKGRVVLLDVGGNVDCKPLHLFQFGLMGSLLSKNLVGVNKPKIALLSIGEEDSKGNLQVKKSHEYFKLSSLNYVGLREGRDILQGDVDVFVCDGFVGNICLKLSESVGSILMDIAKREIESSLMAKIGALFLKKSFKNIKKQVDYREYGSAPLLGLNGTIFICHGSSDKNAIYNGIKNAVKFVKSGYNQQLQKELEHYADIEKRKFWDNIKDKIPFTHTVN